ncbi:MAG: cation transporter, partial [Terriglobales bacterium]
MASSVPATPQILQRIQLVQSLTIAWMITEAAVSLSAAWTSHSPALLAFGGDSAVELLSAVLVIWLFRAREVRPESEKRVARATAVLLFLLAAIVNATAIGAFLGYSNPRRTFLGVAVLMTAAAVMPWFAHEKRRLSVLTGS